MLLLRWTFFADPSAEIVALRDFVLDDDAALDFDDDWWLTPYQLEDDPLGSVILDLQDEDFVVDDEADWFWGRLADEVYDFDHVTTVADEQAADVPADDDDSWTYRLDDQVYDVDQVAAVLDDQIADVPPDDDVEWFWDRLADEVYDFDQVFFVPDEQIADVPPDDDDAWFWDRLVDDAPPPDSGEYIVNLYDFLDDEGFVWPEDDAAWDAYGQIDIPTPLTFAQEFTVSGQYIHDAFGPVGDVSHDWSGGVQKRTV